MEVDSGYFKVNETFACIRELISDTSDIRFPTYAKEDEIWGKYYRVPATGNYVICLLTTLKSMDFEFHLLIEVTADRHIQAIEPYFHGNYPCCWINFDGFFRFGDGVAIRCCGTGSSYCGAQRYLFQNVSPQDSLIALEDNAFFVDEDNSYQEIQSVWSYHHDRVSIEYNYITGSWNWDKNGEEVTFQREKEKRESYTFPLMNGVIVISDESKIPKSIFD